MILGKLLNELSKNILRDRSQLIAGPTDRLWSDETLVSYINDAQMMFARRTLCLRDDETPAYTQFALVEGQQRYVLHPSVIAVVSARYNTDLQDLQRGNHQTYGGMPRTDGWTEQGWNPSAATTATGRPNLYWTDEGLSKSGAVTNQRVIFYIDREPSADQSGDIIYMRVCRLPCELTMDNMEKEPEIPSMHHLDILDWAAYRALRNDDADGATEKAEKFKDSFLKAVAEARQEALRKMHAQIGWAFGLNGYSWER